LIVFIDSFIIFFIDSFIMSNIYQRHRRRVYKTEMNYMKAICGVYSSSILCRPTCNILYNFYFKEEEDELVKILKTPIYINSRYVKNDKGCTEGFRKYYENLLKGDSKSILKESCVKVLVFINKKNLKVFLGYAPKCGLYFIIKSPLLEDDVVLPCNDADLLEQIEELKDEVAFVNCEWDKCREKNLELLQSISRIKKGMIYRTGENTQRVGVSRYDVMIDSLTKIDENGNEVVNC